MTFVKYFNLKFLVFFIGLFIGEVGLCQCTSSILNPLTNVEASTFNDTVIISTTSNAGEYFIIEKLSLDDTYIFSSSNGTDYITIRDKDGLVLLAHGPTPLSYIISGADIVSVHINLVAPPCGAELVDRTTYAVCTTCPPIPAKVEIGSVLEVSGIISVGNIATPPHPGMIRWNDLTNDFEGYDGVEWRTFTGQPAWGTPLLVKSNENQKIISSGGSSNDFFGSSVSISGDYAIIGAPQEDGFSGLINKGAAYIYIRNVNTWIFQHKIQDLLGAAGDFFGSSVSISGDYAIVGAESDDIGASSNQGSAYVFVRNGNVWTQQDKLIASDGSLSDFFGSSVSISGDYAIIGAFRDNINTNTLQGSAYIYERSGTIWTQQAKLTASDGTQNDRFGNSVSISGGYGIVGANVDEVGANIGQGSAYFFIK